ncbi:MAG TPA: type II CAAX endopeptidase family protein [Lactobacillaceae bacterium]
MVEWMTRLQRAYLPILAVMFGFSLSEMSRALPVGSLSTVVILMGVVFYFAANLAQSQRVRPFLFLHSVRSMRVRQTLFWFFSIVTVFLFLGVLLIVPLQIALRLGVPERSFWLSLVTLVVPVVPILSLFAVLTPQFRGIKGQIAFAMLIVFQIVGISDVGALPGKYLASGWFEQLFMQSTLAGAILLVGIVLIWGRAQQILALLSWPKFTWSWVSALVIGSIIALFVLNTGAFVGLGYDLTHNFQWDLLGQSFEAGIAEEALMRYLVLGLLLKLYASRPNGAWRAVVVSSLLFGLFHFQNVVVAPLSGTIDQVIFATAMGLLFAAIYLYTGSLWLAMVLHGLVDWFASLQTGSLTMPSADLAEITLTFGLALVTAGIAWLIVRDPQTQKHVQNGYLQMGK